MYIRPTVIVGLFIQQAIALFVLKSGAGFKLFNWIATLAADFLNEGTVGAGFFFDKETIAKHWFFVNTVRSSEDLATTFADPPQLGSIIFFIAFVQMMYYLGVMQWILKGLCVSYLDSLILAHRAI